MLLNKTKCLCGKELLDETFSDYVPNKDREFYGGRVSMIATHKCECGRELRGFFEANELGELILIDLEVIEKTEEAQAEEIVVENKTEEAETEEIIAENENEKKGDNYIEEEMKTDLNEISSEEKIDLMSISYKELQEYAKAQGIEKVNVKREELIEKLSL